MSAPTFGDATELAPTFTGALTIPIDVPSGVVANSFLIITAYRLTAFADTGIITCAGFTPLDQIRTPSDTICPLWMRAAGNISGTFTLEMSGTTAWTNAVCTRIDGVVETGDPWDFIDTAFEASGTVNGPDVSGTTTVDDTYLYYSGTAANGGNYVAPAGMDLRTAAGGNVMTASATQVTAGPTGSFHYTQGFGGATTSFLGALKPISVTPGFDPRESSSFLVFP